MNHTDMDERLKLLQEKRNQALAGGGLDRLEKQRQAGKLTARERIEYLLDPGTFREIHMFAETQCFEFDMQKKKVLGDGVITGFGTIAGRMVMVYSQDSTVFGGSCGRAHGQKICNIIRMARKSGVPIVGLNDTGGGGCRRGWTTWPGTERCSSKIPRLRGSCPDCRDHGPLHRGRGLLSRPDGFHPAGGRDAQMFIPGRGWSKR